MKHNWRGRMASLRHALQRRPKPVPAAERLLEQHKDAMPPRLYVS